MEFCLPMAVQRSGLSNRALNLEIKNSSFSTKIAYLAFIQFLMSNKRFFVANLAANSHSTFTAKFSFRNLKYGQIGFSQFKKFWFKL